MNKNTINDFLETIKLIQKDPEQTACFAKCKSLDDIEKFIMEKYPQFNFSKKELQKCIVAFGIILNETENQKIQHLHDNQLNISGGYDPETSKAISHIKERNQTFRKGALLIDIMSQVVDSIDSGDTPNILEMNNKIVAAFSGANLSGNYKPKGYANTEGRLNSALTRTVDDIATPKLIYDPNRLNRIKIHDATGRLDQNRFKNLGEVD